MVKISVLLGFISVLWYLSEVESGNPKLTDSGRRCLGACTCFDDINLVDCEAKKYGYVPYGIPVETKTLNLNQNDLSGIKSSDFSDLEQLTHLHLDHNSISTIASLSFANLVSLEQLDLGFNQIRLISQSMFSGLEHLTYLNLQYSGVQNIAPNAFTDLPSLQYLNLDYSSLFSLENESFTGLSNLTSLHIEGTFLYEIPMAALESVKSTLKTLSMVRSSRLNTIGASDSVKIDLPNLRYLNLSYSGIRTILGGSLSGLPSLETLDLSGNALSLLSPRAFVGMSQLQSLHLLYNWFQTFPYSALSSVSETLLHLEISTLFMTLGNLSNAYDNSYLAHLTTFTIDNSELTSIKEASLFKNLINLEHLTISRNSLIRLPTQALRHLQNLQTFRFVGTAMTGIFPGDIPNLPNLKELEFTQSAVSEINDSIFDGVDLEFLRLNDNKIISMTSNALGNQRNLLKIDISNNLLETPDEMWFRDKPLEEIRLTGNPWNCDCLSTNYRTWTNSEEYQNIPVIDQVTCRQPRILRSYQLENIDENELTCEFENCPSTCACTGISTFGSPDNICPVADMMARLLTPVCRGLYEGETAFLKSDLPALMTTGNADCTGSDMVEFPDVPVTTEYLSIASNRINSLQRENFQNLKNLKILVASSNHISIIGNSTFADAELLQQIFLNKNNLKGEINMEWLKNLGSLLELRLDDNGFTGIATNAFVDLNSLQTLDISRNSLASLGSDVFAGLSKLVNLNLPSNYLSFIANDTFENLPNLAYLNLYDNSLSTLFEETIISNLNLIYLDIGDNRFGELPDRFLVSDRLEFLKMENCHILTTLRNGSLSALPKLTTLRLGGNYISEIEPNSFRLNRGDSELKVLDLSDNGLTTIPVETFVGLDRLETLGLHKNSFESIPMLEDSNSQFLPSLKTLSLADTDISEIPENSFISRLPNLLSLIINNCNFDHIPINGLKTLKNLERLILDQNPILKIEEDLSLLANLVHLQLSDTETLESVAETAFDSLVKLETLKLQNGKLQNIPLGAFTNLINLEILSLSENEFTYPHSEWFSSINPEKVKSITLYGNPWECDCNMVEYKHWLDSGANGIDEDFVSITCSSPQPHKSWKLDEIDASDLLCDAITTPSPTQPTTSASTDCDRCSYDEVSRKLDCSGLRLTTVPRNCIPTETAILVLSDNRISEIRDHLGGLSGLKELLLDNNQISIISDDAFSDLVTLYHLDLSHNRLTEVPTTALVPLSLSLVSLMLDDQRIIQINENAFPLNELYQLSLQSLSGNPTPLSLSDFTFGKTTGLRELDLSGNRIITLSTNVFTGLENLNVLKLEDAGLNDFPEVAMRRLPALIDLSLNSNPIEVLNGVTKPILLALQRYYMRESELNRVVEDSFLNGLIHLVELDLGFSMLENIPTNALINKPVLTAIKFDHSSIFKISTSDFQTLSENDISNLDLSHSKIIEIENKAFSDLKNLTILDLNSNQITLIADDAFLNTKLQSIDISFNNLTYLSCTWLDMLSTGQLQTVKLSGNRYDCSCGMVGYRQYMMTPQYATIMYADDPVCTSPSQFAGQRLGDIEVEVLEKYCLEDENYFQPTYCSQFITTAPIESTSERTASTSVLTTSGARILKELKHLRVISVVMSTLWFINTLDDFFG